MVENSFKKLKTGWKRIKTDEKGWKRWENVKIVETVEQLLEMG